MLTNRLYRRAARILTRGGFTLVELLVVIGIIAILAGVALGPIMTGLKKAKQNAAVQQSHAIGMAMFAFANDNNQLYPDTSNPSTNASSGAAAAAWALLAGNYVSDPAQFWLSGGTAQKYTATPATSIPSANISFDFAGGGGGGLSTTAAQYLPLFWDSIGATAMPTTYKTAGSAMVFTPTSTSVFQTTGMTFFYCNESAAFVTALSGTCTPVAGGSNTGYTGTVTVLTGGD